MKEKKREERWIMSSTKVKKRKAIFCRIWSAWKHKCWSILKSKSWLFLLSFPFKKFQPRKKFVAKKQTKETFYLLSQTFPVWFALIVTKFMIWDKSKFFGKVRQVICARSHPENEECPSENSVYPSLHLLQE